MRQMSSLPSESSRVVLPDVSNVSHFREDTRSLLRQHSPAHALWNSSTSKREHRPSKHFIASPLTCRTAQSLGQKLVYSESPNQESRTQAIERDKSLFRAEFLSNFDPATNGTSSWELLSL